MTLVALDTETFVIRPGLLAPPLVCVSWATDDACGLLDRRQGLVFIADLLHSPNVDLVGHNAPYDFGVVCAADERLIKPVFEAYRAGRIQDTKVCQKLIDIAAGCHNFPRADGTKGYTLASLETHWLGIDRSAQKQGPDVWRLRYHELVNVPPEQWPPEAREYAMDDARGTLLVRGKQGVVTNEAQQVRADWALHLMSCWGVRTDPDAVEQLASNLTVEHERNFKRLLRAGLYKPRRATKAEVDAGEVDFFEPGKVLKNGTQKDPRPMRYALDKAKVQAAVVKNYKKLGRRLPMTDGTATRDPTVATDKDALSLSGSRVLRLLADGGGVTKLLTTYVPALRQGATAPINVRFNVLVNSGRTSSYGERTDDGRVQGFNIQNLPTGRRVGGVRECLIPRPGFLFVSVDYDTLELRALAQVCLWLFKWSRMADAIRAGKDLHVDMAASMLGLSYEEGWKRHKAKDKAFKNARDCAKVANFGLPGGLGANTLVDYARKGYSVTLTVAQSMELKRAWLKQWPEMRHYFNLVGAQVGEGGDAKLQQFHSQRVRGAVGYTDGCNTYFQGLAADGAKEALFDVSYECYVDQGTALFGCRPVAFVHDEIVAEVPEESAHEAAARLAHVMCTSMARVIPDVPITATPALMRRWFKGAEAVYDNDGKLVPWEPKAA